MRDQASRGFVAGRRSKYLFRYSNSLCIAKSLQHHREGAMNIAIAKPKLGKDSKGFVAKKQQMLITEG
jgi:hypothetical protein